MDHGPGLLEPFLCQIWTLLKGVGRRMAGLASSIVGLLDWLADEFAYLFRVVAFWLLTGIQAITYYILSCTAPN